jgi:hypothetical protein
MALINGISLDPVAQSEALRAARLEPRDASHSDYVLIQTHGPLNEEQKQELAGLGVEIQEYVPESTYLCRYGPSDLDAIRALPFVVWAGVYLQGFKIAPSLRPAPPDPAGSVLPTTVPRSPSRQPREVDVVLHDDVDPDAVKQELAAAAGVDADQLQLGRRKVRLTVQQGELPKRHGRVLEPGAHEGEAIQAGCRGAGDVHPLDPLPRRRHPVNRLRDLVGLAVLLRQRDEHGHAAGRGLHDRPT